MASPASVLLIRLLAALAVPWLPSGLASPPSDGCQRRCGSVDIPFPFGIGPAQHCMLPHFEINCIDTGNGTRKAMFRDNVELLDISLARGEARVLVYISFYCYDKHSQRMTPSEWQWNMKGTPFTFSDTANKFTVVGCRTLAYIGDSSVDDAATYRTGCVAMCDDQRAALVNGSCSGMGCCQTAIPSGLQNYQVWFDRRINTSEINGVSPCSFAVLMESSDFNFSSSYVTSLEFNSSRSGQAPVVLDWRISDDDCRVAPWKPGYACVSNNSRCLNAAGGPGYICNCTQGYEGNPYITDGCKDINECNHTANPCYGVCINTEGNFTCSCPAGRTGNAYIQNQCHRDAFPMGARLSVGIVAALLLFLLGFLATEVFLHKRRNKRQGYFEQHGGQMLLNFLKSDGNISFTLYERGELVKATRNFHKDNSIGEGAHGTVYKAILSGGGGDNDDTTVAVKRCKQIDPSRTKEFLQELFILCRVNHPNVIKLLGCCLHFQAPMLVYEFVQNGTLDKLLHGRPERRVMLATRLRIAAETAEALVHLHLPPHPILHGDMKPENILLGDGWAAKVSDFGCSTIDDNAQVVPKGTLAYLDPEFLEDFQIAAKTDVYSFGVVLMELLTRKKPLAKQQKNLAIMFQECMGNGTLVDLLDTEIVKEGSSTMVVIHKAAELACRCTAVPGKERPAMGEVAQELRQLSDMVPENSEALQALEGHGYSSPTTSENETTRFPGIGRAALSTELAR